MSNTKPESGPPSGGERCPYNRCTGIACKCCPAGGRHEYRVLDGGWGECVKCKPGAEPAVQPSVSAREKETTVSDETTMTFAEVCEEIESLLAEIPQERWVWTRNPGDAAELVRLVSENLSKSPIPELWGIALDDDNLRNDREARTVCFTGNGPNSERHARLLMLVRQALPELLTRARDAAQPPEPSVDAVERVTRDAIRDVLAAATNEEPHALADDVMVVVRAALDRAASRQPTPTGDVAEPMTPHELEREMVAVCDAYKDRSPEEAAHQCYLVALYDRAAHGEAVRREAYSDGQQDAMYQLPVAVARAAGGTRGRDDLLAAIAVEIHRMRQNPWRQEDMQGGSNE